MDKIGAALIYLGFLFFVGWVFTITSSGFSFLLLIFMPDIEIKNSCKKCKKIEKEQYTKIIKD